MKKIIFAAVLFTALSGCSFVKDVQKHCVFSETDLDVTTGSFKGCLECDSLAKVVKKAIDKQANN